MQIVTRVQLLKLQKLMSHKDYSASFCTSDKFTDVSRIKKTMQITNVACTTGQEITNQGCLKIKLNLHLPVFDQQLRRNKPRRFFPDQIPTTPTQNYKSKNQITKQLSYAIQTYQVQKKGQYTKMCRLKVHRF
eukprot:TRINITY_DN13356_c0_g1_i5.p3 TRINITY_DN13356_c0_g1~~TRINITY_DN13356_c0_g1_i5.p3  ORF type:complete len:133 (-),score=4.65 TRINITY_DN13356_c0_g1_i5:416-814(-)